MARYAALLRAINVGGTAKLPMANLRDVLEGLGFSDVETLLASGNAIFSAAKTSMAELESSIETALAREAELKTDVIVRTARQWTALIDGNPMPDETDHSPAKVGVMLMKTGPDKKELAAYLKRYEGPEQVIAGKESLYIHFPDGMGRSKLNIGKKIGTGTVRNWNTVLKIAAKLEAD